MYSYNYNEKNKFLYISLNSKINYSFEFINNSTDMLKKIINSPCSTVIFLYQDLDNSFDKMGLAYLYILLLYIVHNKKVLIDKNISNLFTEHTSHSKSGKLMEINISDMLKNNTANSFNFTNENSVNEAVQAIVNFIISKNLVFNATEFLFTTIGEIFSNAFNHSNEKSIYLMYDILYKNNNFYLIINITDFGKTIIGNIREYKQQSENIIFESEDCVKWAIQPGNTTRSGSGGYGLPTLISYVKAINGELYIFSGDCFYSLVDLKENISLSKGMFYGTSVSMTIPLYDCSKIITYDSKTNTVNSISLDKV